MSQTVFPEFNASREPQRQKTTNHRLPWNPGKMAFAVSSVEDTSAAY